MIKLGIEKLIQNKKIQKGLQGARIAILGHPASVDHQLTHSLDLLQKQKTMRLTAAFGPQHGMRGEKQDNMVESDDFVDSKLGIPVFSLYGKTRRLTPEMLSKFDVLLFDLQDLGCRIYTFATTLKYVLEDCFRAGKSVWVLDRPNPAGRPVEGLRLRSGWESFVGAGPMPMRHGLTLGELALWYLKHFELEGDLKVIPMNGYRISSAPGFGWPMDRVWINPSPNAANLNMARSYAGTVLIEGTSLSEGRGTTRPLEVVGAPDLDMEKILKTMVETHKSWLTGCSLRTCYFQPTFHKHANQLCSAIQIHAEGPHYKHQAFQPFRLVALLLKSIRKIAPSYPLWRDFPYEYEQDRLAFDVIAGGPLLREWIDDSTSKPQDLEKILKIDESSWKRDVSSVLLY